MYIVCNNCATRRFHNKYYGIAIPLTRSGQQQPATTWKFSYLGGLKLINMKRFLPLLFLGFSLVATAQDIKIIDGNLGALKNEPSVKVVLTYNNMIIGDDRIKEQEYIDKKREELNKKEAGRGDEWEKSWKESREKRFQPKFIELFEKYSKKKVSDDAKYTLSFNTSHTEVGWVGLGLVRRNAAIDGVLTIFETANPQNVIATVTVDKAPGYGGMGYDYDPGFRLQEAYAKIGKELGKLIAKGKK